MAASPDKEDNKPVAWAFYWPDGRLRFVVEGDRADRWRTVHEGEVVPLFAGNQPCPYVTGRTTQYCTLTPFTLTDAEREAVEWAVSAAEDCQHPADDALRGLLERTETGGK